MESSERTEISDSGSEFDSDDLVEDESLEGDLRRPAEFPLEDFLLEDFLLEDDLPERDRLDDNRDRWGDDLLVDELDDEVEDDLCLRGEYLVDLESEARWLFVEESDDGRRLRGVVDRFRFRMMADEVEEDDDEDLARLVEYRCTSLFAALVSETGDGWDEIQHVLVQWVSSCDRFESERDFWVLRRSAFLRPSAWLLLVFTFFGVILSALDAVSGFFFTGIETVTVFEFLAFPVATGSVLPDVLVVISGVCSGLLAVANFVFSVVTENAVLCFSTFFAAALDVRPSLTRW